MKPTEQQTAIIKNISTQEGRHLVCDARAGSGKTSTLVVSVKNAVGRGAFEPSDIVNCAFNRSIAETLDKKMPQGTLNRTLNSIGHRAWIGRCRGTVKLEKNKSYNIAQELQVKQLFPGLPKALSIAKAWGLIPKGAPASPAGLVEDTPEIWDSLFDEYAIDLGSVGEQAFSIARAGLLKSIDLAWKGEIDFDDQLYMPTIYKAEFPQGKLVLVDEAQDISNIQRRMARLMLRPEGRLIAVGDRYQAIYGFRGANRRSIPDIENEFGAEVLPLTTSFRCPKAVIAEAQKIVPDIDPWSDAKDGRVETLESWGKSSIPYGSAILCRYNAPLMRICLQLISDGVGARIKGRDIAAGLKALVNKQKVRKVGEMTSLLHNYQQRECARLEEKLKASAAELLRDKCACIHMLASQFDVQDTVGLFNRRLDELFVNGEKPPVLLSTIHKAKGLEWKDVFILDRDSMPSKWAKTHEELAQEMNLIYVAVTRSMENLTYIDTEEYRK